MSIMPRGAQLALAALLPLLAAWLLASQALAGLFLAAFAFLALRAGLRPARTAVAAKEGQRVVMGFRRESFEWTPEHVPPDVVATWEQRTDAAADAVFVPGMGADAFEKAMGEHAVLPDWVNYQLLDEGCSFFVQLWPWVFYNFGWAVLGGFGAESASAVLLESRYWAAKGKEGQLDTWNRLRETACWLFDVAVHGSDGFREGAVSWKACLRVRHLHTRTRAHIGATGKWDGEKFGQPINQAQLIGTLLGSSILLIQGMEEMSGVRFPERKREAYLHLWAVIGFLFGIDEDINPNRSCRQAEVMMQSVFSQGIPMFPDQKLTGVLTNHICESVATGVREEYGVPATAGLVSAASWLFLGEQYCSAICLPKCSRMDWILANVRCRMLALGLLVWHLPCAPSVFEMLMRRCWVSLVRSIRARQPKCRFGLVPPCPMKAA